MRLWVNIWQVMEKYEIERIRATPIESLAIRLGLEVSHRRARCCFHDDHTPSMALNVRKNTFCCYACGAHGDVIDLVQRVLNLGFMEACAWIAGNQSLVLHTEAERKAQRLYEPAKPFEAARYARFFEHPWLSEAARRFLFEERRLHPKVVEFCHLNSYGDWLQIPYYNAEGQLVGIQKRYLGTEPGKPKFLFQAGQQPRLYGLQILRLLKPQEPLYIGEGPSDTWALLSSGKKAIGVPSATLLRQEDMKLLVPLVPLETPLHLYPDQDAAGHALAERLTAFAAELGLQVTLHELPKGCKDFAEGYLIEGPTSALP